MIAFLRNLVTHDFWLKLFSLALAVLIWVTLSIAKEGGLGNRAAVETFHLPVRIVSASTDVSAFKGNPAEVTVRVRGVASKLQGPEGGDIHALIDLTGLAPLKESHQHVQITAPADFTILDITPAEVEIIPPPPPPKPTIFFNQ